MVDSTTLKLYHYGQELKVRDHVYVNRYIYTIRYSWLMRNESWRKRIKKPSTFGESVLEMTYVFLDVMEWYGIIGYVSTYN